MTRRLPRLPSRRGDPTRASEASLEQVEGSVRQRLYGERRMVELVIPERTREALGEPSRPNARVGER